MASLSFYPSTVDITAYAGDSFKILFEVIDQVSEAYGLAGAWGFSFYNQISGSVVDTTPSGISISPANNDFTSEEYLYVATANQTTFTGLDENEKTLNYVVDELEVYKNDVLVNPTDYTATNGSSVILDTGATENDEIKIVAIDYIEPTGTVEISVGNELTAMLNDNENIVYELYITTNTDRYTIVNGNVSITDITSI